MAPSTTGSRSGSPLIVVTQHKPWRAQGFCTVQRCRVAAGLPVPAHAELAVVAVPAAAVRVLQAETLGAEPTHKAPNSCRPTRPEIRSMQMPAHAVVRVPMGSWRRTYPVRSTIKNGI